jgi:hypothetical protein
MAREKISLIPDELKEVKHIENMIQSGEINKDNFHQLSPIHQQEVNKILFDMAESQINLSQGVSAIEFVLFAYIRIMSKQAKGLALSAEDKKVEEGLNRVLELHQITDGNTSIDDWLFNYMEYAEAASVQILGNRSEHINRKREVTGNI